MNNWWNDLGFVGAFAGLTAVIVGIAEAITAVIRRNQEHTAMTEELDTIDFGTQEERIERYVRVLERQINETIPQRTILVGGGGGGVGSGRPLSANQAEGGNAFPSFYAANASSMRFGNMVVPVPTISPAAPRTQEEPKPAPAPKRDMRVIRVRRRSENEVCD